MFTSTIPSPQPSLRLGGARELFPFGAGVKLHPRPPVSWQMNPASGATIFKPLEDNGCFSMAGQKKPNWVVKAVK